MPNKAERISRRNLSQKSDRVLINTSKPVPTDGADSDMRISIGAEADIGLHVKASGKWYEFNPTHGISWANNRDVTASSGAHDISYIKGGVGIGTTTLKAPFHVVTTDRDEFHGASTAAFGTIAKFERAANVSEPSLFIRSQGNTEVILASEKAIGFNTDATDTNNGTATLYCAETQYVGIGPFNNSVLPTSRLHVSEQVTYGWAMRIDNTSTNTGTDGLIIDFPNVDAIAGDGSDELDSTGHWLAAATAQGVRRAWRGDSAGGVNLYVASDRSLKENIIDIPGALEIIGDLKPRRFNFKGGNVSKYQYGFIADEFKTVFPAKVSKFNEGESNESECISVEHLTGILTKAIQELTARIEALEGA